MSKEENTKKAKIIQRNIQKPILELALNRHKMVFLSGPRQAGKTTFSKAFISDISNYKSWDQPSFRKVWTKSSEDFAEQVIGTGFPLIVLDEFHKNKKWKNQLKGFYDKFGDHIKILVTGSAKLNTFRKGADDPS